MSDKPILLVVLGTRPEAIKLGTVLPVLRRSSVFETKVLWTGQHPLSELGEVAVFFGIAPDSVLQQWGVIDVPVCSEPDVVLVQGDTLSTSMGAAIAKRFGAKLVHLEAGFRCWDRSLPEERIRVAVDEQADLLLCPSHGAALNARVSAKVGAEVHVVGQTGLDALHMVRRCSGPSFACDPMTQGWSAREFQRKTRVQLWDPDAPEDGISEVVLLTVHRAARTETVEALRPLIEAVAGVATAQVVWPVHPRIRRKAEEDPAFAALLTWAAEEGGIVLCDPIPYEVMVRVLDLFAGVVTDSGGLVEECAVLGVPCVIARPSTERVEPVGEGHAVLCPDDRQIVRSLLAVMDARANGPAPTYYGERPGQASQLTLRSIEALFHTLDGSDLFPEPKDNPDV